MSTTFDVFPSIKQIPTFGELLHLSNIKLKEYLNSIQIFDEVKLTAEIHKKDESIILDTILEDSFKWDDDFYACFFIQGIPGGTDAYFWDIDNLHREIWDEEIKSNKKAYNYRDKIKKSIEVGYRWNFRKSAGQPGIIVLSYGLLAASLCELTDGLIYTDDGAWDYSLFPTTAADFFRWYFRPELSNKHDDKVWSEKCIISLRQEFKRLKKGIY